MGPAALPRRKINSGKGPPWGPRGHGAPWGSQGHEAPWGTQGHGPKLPRPQGPRAQGREPQGPRPQAPGARWGAVFYKEFSFYKIVNWIFIISNRSGEGLTIKIR